MKAQTDLLRSLAQYNRTLKVVLRANDNHDAFLVEDDRSAGSERLTVNAGGEMVVNDTSADYDFRVESDSNANAFVLDAGLNRIGMGIASPAESLHVYDSSAASDVKGVRVSMYRPRHVGRPFGERNDWQMWADSGELQFLYGNLDVNNKLPNTALKLTDATSGVIVNDGAKS